MENNNVLILICVLILVVRTDAIFRCKTIGRFPDPTDLTCKKYFNCGRTFFGTMWGTSSRCINSNFDPSTQKCSTTYPCRTAPISTTGLFSFLHPQFTCSSAGFFPDLEDKSCRRYFSCVKLFSDVFHKVAYNCQDSMFDPTLRKCSEDYDCKKDKPSLEDVIKVEKYNSNSEQDFKERDRTEESLSSIESIATAKYLIISTNSVVAADLTTVATTVQSASSDFKEPSASTENHFGVFTEQSTSSIPIAETKSDGFACTMAGKFPDLEDESCSQYFLCSNLRNGTILKTTYHCPNSTFDPFLMRCSKLYHCEPDKSSTANSPFDIFTSAEADILPIIGQTMTIDLGFNFERNTESVQTETESKIPLTSESNTEEFSCPELGKFPDLTDRTCQKYYHCEKLKDGTFIQSVHACSNSMFDPVLQECSKNYDCPHFQSIATSVTTTLFENTEVQMHTTENFVSESHLAVYDFRCFQAGRFPDLNDFTCKWYFLCNRLRNGTFIQTPYECPSNSIFDPLIQLCSTHTTCSYKMNYFTL